MSNNQYFTDDNQYREFLDKIEVLNHDEEFEKIIDIIIEIPENDSMQSSVLF